MAATIKTFKDTGFIDVSTIVRNFKTNSVGTNVRVSASGKILQQMADVINSIMYMTPMTYFTKSSDFSIGWGNNNPDIMDGYPIIFPDFGPYALTRRILLSIDPAYSANYTFETKPRVKYYYTSSLTEKSQMLPVSEATRTYRYSNQQMGVIPIIEISSIPENTHVEEAIWVGLDDVPSASGFGFQPSIVEHLSLTEKQSRYAVPFSGITGNTCSTNLTKPFRPILADGLENLRQAFHKVRTTRSQIILSWGTPNGTTSVYMGTNSSSFENVLDSTVSAWSNTSPGFSTVAYMAGIGPEDETSGQTVNVECYIYGCSYNSNSPAGEGTVRFCGPINLTNNYVDITVEDEWKWYTSVSYVKLNTGIEWDNETTSRNKIDILSKIGSGGDEIRIRGLFARITFQ